MNAFPRPAYRSITPYRPDRRPVPVDLSDNTNRWGVHPAALAAIRGSAAEDLVRYPSVYADRLRAAIAESFRVPPDAVGTGTGSDDLLDSAFRAAADPGGVVAYVPPTFSMIETFARMNGLAAVGVPGAGPPDPLPSPGSLLAAEPSLVYLCRPDNPTGRVIPGAWIRSLVDEAGPEGPVIVVDEAYADFLPAGPAEDAWDRPGALVRAAADSDRLVVVRTFSKAYGLAGLRVGYAVGAPEVIREIEKSRGPYKVGVVAEAAAVAALRDREGWVARVRADVERERAYLRGELEARGLEPLPSSGNFLLVPLGDTDARGVGAGLRERGVAVRPFPRLAGIGEAVRITVGPRAEMDRLLAALDEVRHGSGGRPALPPGPVRGPDGPAEGAPAPELALFDYGAGNLHSLRKGLERGGARVRITEDWDEALALDGLVLPGVGSFGVAVQGLRGRQDRIRECLEEGLPCLGICLGMQLLFSESEEAGGRGIGLLPGRVRRLRTGIVPHMGWNDVEAEGDPVFRGVAAPGPSGASWPRRLTGRFPAYYAHSYLCEVEDPDTVIARSRYEDEAVAAAVRVARTVGVQFHPEKSAAPGLRLLGNFVGMAARAARRGRP